VKTMVESVRARIGLPVGVGFGITGPAPGRPGRHDRGRGRRRQRGHAVGGGSPRVGAATGGAGISAGLGRRRAHGAGVNRSSRRRVTTRMPSVPPRCGRAANHAPSSSTGSSSSAGSSSVRAAAITFGSPPSSACSCCSTAAASSSATPGRVARRPRFPDEPPYGERLPAMASAPGHREAVVTGTGRVDARRDRDRRLQLPLPRRQHGVGGRREADASHRARAAARAARHRVGVGGAACRKASTR
jgi:hypothetical protein